MKAMLRYFCLAYTALLALGRAVGLGIAFPAPYGDLSGNGCTFYDALLFGIDCRGFAGANLVEWLVGFPLLVLTASAMALLEPLTLLLSVPLWLPVGVAVYLLVKTLLIEGPR